MIQVPEVDIQDFAEESPNLDVSGESIETSPVLTLANRGDRLKSLLRLDHLNAEERRSLMSLIKKLQDRFCSTYQTKNSVRRKYFSTRSR